MADYIDIHSHLNFPEYDTDRADVLARMKAAGVATITVGTNLETSRSAVALAHEAAEKGVEVYACVGLHPADDPAAEWGTAIAVEFETLARDPRTVAIGECGLDYFKIGTTRDGKVLTEEEIAAVKARQREIFLAQIALAQKVGKPLMIHCRDAYDDVYEILAKAVKETKHGAGGKMLTGNMHFFAGDLETAQKFIDIGFTLSFTGVITFARNYDDIIRSVPLESIMSETDAPFVAPAPYRGKRNESTYVTEVVKKIAEVRGEDAEKVNKTILKNAKRVFQVS